ncbi:MAG: hypothetical protein KGQ41_03995 [Alphaproteobacteria bacterium]|nr:hypothetical protein [Alphaproteobacteria bacterium]
MSVTTRTPFPRTRMAIEPMVRQARELAGNPAKKQPTHYEIERERLERLEAERELYLKREWQEAEGRKRKQEEEETAQERWMFFVLMMFLVAMFRQNAHYQPDMAF